MSHLNLMFKLLSQYHSHSVSDLHRKKQIVQYWQENFTQDKMSRVWRINVLCEVRKHHQPQFKSSFSLQLVTN